jgi:hypothetical protein
LQGITANIIRGIFYFSVGVLIAGVGGTISDALESRTRHIIGDLLFLALVALVALGLRFWAVSAQNPTGKERKLRPETIRRALLFYRLGGFNASLVRIVFYTYTILAVALISFQPWGNLKLLPNNIGLTIAFAGFGVGFRHWAAALGTAGKDNATKRQLPSGASVQKRRQLRTSGGSGSPITARIRVPGSRCRAPGPHEPSEPAARLPAGNFQGTARFITDHRPGALRCPAPAETSTV